MSLDLRRIPRALLATGVVAVGLTLVGGVAVAVASYSGVSSNGQILSCMNKRTYTIRIVDHPACRSDETLLSWNQRGPAGARGLTGATGPAGGSGPAGAPGATGAAGANGANGVNGANGSAGPSGPPGPMGVAGPSGAPGPSGPSGPPGPSGAPGTSGAAATSFTSGSTVYVVPANTHQLELDLWGGGGGGGGGDSTTGAGGGGSSGNYTHAFIPVTPGDTCTVAVGAGGAGGAGSASGNGGVGTHGGPTHVTCGSKDAAANGGLLGGPGVCCVDSGGGPAYTFGISQNATHQEWPGLAGAGVIRQASPCPGGIGGGIGNGFGSYNGFYAMGGSGGACGDGNGGTGLPGSPGQPGLALIRALP